MWQYTQFYGRVEVIVYGGGIAADIRYPDGTSTFLQGDDAAELVDTLEEDAGDTEVPDILFDYRTIAS